MTLFDEEQPTSAYVETVMSLLIPNITVLEFICALLITLFTPSITATLSRTFNASIVTSSQTSFYLPH
ncbi:hypothetical protein O3M35_000049 [Rhynocoris fuscipes]|uniref:Uncharacterized protein n=1 Tax=Rhynocoris fuscipes TaxID=488301 RepID=A0AAW1DK43_9HEMI